MTSTQPQPWHRQSWETEAQYRAFCVYRDMTLPRSVDGAYRLHLQQSDRLQTGDKQVIEKRAPGGWQQWAKGRKWNGQPIPGAESWDERVKSHDQHMQQRLDDELEEMLANERRQLIWDELADYKQQLVKFRETWLVADKPPEPERLVVEEVDRKTGRKTIRITETLVVDVGVDDWMQLSKWRQLISAQGRLVLKMPSRIEQQRLAGEDGGPLVMQWVDPLDEDGDIGIGEEELP